MTDGAGIRRPRAPALRPAVVVAVTPDLAKAVETWLAHMLPDCVGVAALPIDAAAACGSDLDPAEFELVRHAVAERRRDFSAGRASARAALRKAGCPAGLAARAIGRGRWSQPLWPPGFTGSISHDGGLAVAVAHPVEHRLRHAVDLAAARPAAELAEILTVLLTPQERRPRDGDSDSAGDPVLRLFSAKECAIKLLSPRLERFVDFTELVGVPGPHGLRVHCAALGPVVDTRCTVVDGLLLTVATLPVPLG